MSEYRGRKYRDLYACLFNLTTQEWRASFAEVEAVIGENLPPSARNYQAWWANDSTHSQGAAWAAAGWETAEVDLARETLLFRRRRTSDLGHPSKSRTKLSGLEKADDHALNAVPASSNDSLDALNQLQASLEDREVNLAEWAQNLRTERRAIER